MNTDEHGYDNGGKDVTATATTDGDGLRYDKGKITGGRERVVGF
jgi:hypothetical protein